MDTFYEHQWGLIEKNWHISTIVRANVYKGEEDEALDKGFISDDGEPDYWYNCRSVRVPLKKNARPYNGDLNVSISNSPTDEALELYKNWCKRKGYATHEGDDRVFNTDTYIHYYDEEDLVAYSKIRKYKESAELLLACSKEGNILMETLRFELDYLRSDGFKWAYLGQAYEESSAWKCDQSKMQWWDGNKWNTNKEELRELCIRDSLVGSTMNGIKFP